jgi:hypothetical protein
MLRLRTHAKPKRGGRIKTVGPVDRPTVSVGLWLYVRFYFSSITKRIGQASLTLLRVYEPKSKLK